MKDDMTGWVPAEGTVWRDVRATDPCSWMDGTSVKLFARHISQCNYISDMLYSIHSDVWYYAEEYTKFTGNIVHRGDWARLLLTYSLAVLQRATQVNQFSS
jgi:hypothetical protein